MPQDESALQEMRAARSTGDISQIRHLFAAGRLTAGDASDVLQSSLRNPVLLRLLLEHGADPDGLNINQANCGESLRILAEFGYDVKSHGHLVLHKFARDRETLDWLLDQGVDINCTNTRRRENGASLAHGGSENSLKILNNVAAAGDIALFDHLVASGADVSRSLSLHSASKCQDESSAVISHLLEKYKMDIHADTDDLREFFHDAPDSGTPLCSAIHHANLAAVGELLSRGADPERCGKSGYPPVIKAIGDPANVGFLPALKPLLESGVDSQFALTCAVRHSKLEAAKICLQAGADPRVTLSVAVEVGNANVREAAVDELEENDAAVKESEAMIQLLESWIRGG